MFSRSWGPLLLLSVGFTLFCIYTLNNGANVILIYDDADAENAADDPCDFDRIVRQYLDARKTGLSQEEVAEKVFNVRPSKMSR